MDRRTRLWYRAHLLNQIPESVLLRQHVEKILPPAYDLLDPLRIQEAPLPHPVGVAVGRHLENEVLDPAEAEAAVPTCIRQDEIRLPRMAVPGPVVVHVGRRPPAGVAGGEFEGVEVVHHLEVDHGRHGLAPPQQLHRLGARDLVRIRHDDDVPRGNAGPAKQEGDGGTVAGLHLSG